MRPSSVTDAVRAVVRPAVESAGLVLEDLTVTPAGRRRVLRVTVDLPADRTGGVPLDDVARASQAVSQALDADEAMGGQPYVLEVSSPGVDRPLTEPRHWSRARGRVVDATLVDGGSVTGRVTAVDDGGVAFDGGDPVAWHHLVRGRVQVEFSRDGDLPEGGALEDDLSGDDDGPDEEVDA